MPAKNKMPIRPKKEKKPLVTTGKRHAHSSEHKWFIKSFLSSTSSHLLSLLQRFCPSCWGRNHTFRCLSNRVSNRGFYFFNPVHFRMNKGNPAVLSGTTDSRFLKCLTKPVLSFIRYIFWVVKRRSPRLKSNLSDWINDYISHTVWFKDRRPCEVWRRIYLSWKDNGWIVWSCLEPFYGWSQLQTFAHAPRSDCYLFVCFSGHGFFFSIMKSYWFVETLTKPKCNIKQSHSHEEQKQDMVNRLEVHRIPSPNAFFSKVARKQESLTFADLWLVICQFTKNYSYLNVGCCSPQTKCQTFVNASSV